MLLQGAANDTGEPMADGASYTFSLVTQGQHRFFSLTIPTDVLAATCFVTTRVEDPKEGFQRLLDRKRAQEIADYIDSGFGTIPNSIVLSAQPEANLRVKPGGRALSFQRDRRAFLILDGQHRVYGFSLAKTALRVPVVIYQGLTRAQESRLFIDINTKQRPVPNELLLDIKSLADVETTDEQLLRDIFDRFHSTPGSALYGKLSPAEKSSTKLSRVSFNGGLKGVLPVFAGRGAQAVFDTLDSYLHAVNTLLARLKVGSSISNSIVFRAVAALFPSVAQRVQDRFGTEYTADNFYSILAPLESKLAASKLRKPGNSYRELLSHLQKALKDSFTL